MAAAQSRLMSLVEAVTNVAVGYGFAVMTQIVMFPWLGLTVPLGGVRNMVRRIHRRGFSGKLGTKAPGPG